MGQQNRKILLSLFLYMGVLFGVYLKLKNKHMGGHSYNCRSTQVSLTYPNWEFPAVPDFPLLGGSPQNLISVGIALTVPLGGGPRYSGPGGPLPKRQSRSRKMPNGVIAKVARPEAVGAASLDPRSASFHSQLLLYYILSRSFVKLEIGFVVATRRDSNPRSRIGVPAGTLSLAE
jgi:hypothetical protein